MSKRQQVYELLEPAKRGDHSSRAVDMVILTLITINVSALILETVDSFYGAWKPWFDWIEFITVAVFSLEYVLRV